MSLRLERLNFRRFYKSTFVDDGTLFNSKIFDFLLRMSSKQFLDRPVEEATTISLISLIDYTILLGRLKVWLPDVCKLLDLVAKNVHLSL